MAAIYSRNSIPDRFGRSRLISAMRAQLAELQAQFGRSGLNSLQALEISKMPVDLKIFRDESLEMFETLATLRFFETVFDKAVKN